MRKRYIAFVFGLVALLMYLALDTISPSKQREASAILEPDYIIQGLQAEYYSAEGLLNQQIDAQSARHLPETNQTLFEQPSVIIRKGTTPEWGMRAASGLLTANQQLSLSGSVQVVPLSDNQAAYSLTTEKLDIDLRQEIAETAELVLIEGVGTELQARGMHLNFKEQQARFNAEVRGRHDPKAEAQITQ